VALAEVDQAEAVAVVDAPSILRMGLAITTLLRMSNEVGMATSPTKIVQ
jgi:hypothetical protein